MLGKHLRARFSKLVASNQNVPHRCTPLVGGVALSNVRALATGAALVTSIDTTPVAVVSIYDYARQDASTADRRAC
jgi:hypothetical protein